MEITDPPENRVSIKILVPRFGWSSHARDFSADCTFKDVLETFATEAQLIGINLLRGDVVFEDITVRPTRNLTEEFGGHDEVICRSLHQLELWSSVSVSMLISGDRGEDTTVANSTSSADELRNDIKQASASHSFASSPSRMSLPVAFNQWGNDGADDQRDKNVGPALSERLITITVIPVHEASTSFKLRPFRCLDTVGLVKARAAAASLRDGSLSLAPAESLQLVYRGNILSDDDATLAAVGIGNSVGGGGVTLIGVRQRRQEGEEEPEEQLRNEEAQEAQEQELATRLEYEHEETREVPVRRAEEHPSQSRPSTMGTARQRAGPHDICRICLEGAAAGPLITPCLCTGTINFIHADCLAQWRATQRGDAATKCGTCGYKYRVERTRWAAFLLSDHGAYVLTAVVVVLLVYLSASCAAILWRLLVASIPGAATHARGVAVAVMRRLRAIPQHHQPLVQLHDIMMQVPEESAQQRAELSAPFPPLWPLWRPTIPSVFWLGRRPIMLQKNLPVWMWHALQAHMDFLMGGLYVLGAVGFACYMIQELLGNLLPPILYLWYYNRQRLQHGRRNNEVNDYQDHRRNEGDAAAVEIQRGEGHQTVGTLYFVSLSGRWYRASVSVAAAVLRRLWVIASFPWNGLVIPEDFRRYLNPNFAVLVAWFVSFYQNSSGGAFTRLVICIGVPLISRSAVVYYALPHGRRLAQRLGERMLEIHEN